MTPTRRVWTWCTSHRAATALIVSFGGVAASFTAATAIAQSAGLEIRSAAAEITGNSSASISQLSAVRGLLRQLEVRAENHIDRCEGPACRDIPESVPRLLHESRGRWAEYKKLPVFAQEPRFWPRIDAGFDGLERELRRITALLEAGEGARAEAAFKDKAEPVFDDLDLDVGRLMESEHAEGLKIAARIDALARHSLVRAILLDLLSVALTIVTAALAVRLVRREELLLRARADELDRFAGQVSHEILNPLCAIDTALYTARRGSAPASRQALDRIGDGVEYVRHLVGGLLEFARSSSLPPARVASELREVVEQVLEQLRPLADRERVALATYGPLSARIACSDCVLATILSNLVTNGIKHLGDTAVRAVAIRSPVGSAGRVRIEVVDTGPGIEPAVRDRVFEPFVRGRTSAAGFGLGLATVKRLVDAHGGEIGFSPEPAGGTCFWVELPPASADQVVPAVERPWRGSAEVRPTG